MTLQELKEKAKHIQLAVFDLDGTLLNPQGEITEETLSAIKMLKRKGIRIGIASGRIYSMTTMYHHILDDHDFVLTSNGATIHKAQEDQPIQKLTLDAMEAKQVIDFCVKEHIECNIFKNEACYFQSFSSRLKRFDAYNIEAKQLGVKEATTLFYTDQIPSYEDIEKLLVIETDSAKSEKVIRFIENHTHLAHTQSGPGYIDVSNPDVSKGNAVKKLAEYLKIPLSSVCAFGDYDNDISMLEIAGLSIVPANAQPSVFPYADYVTLSHEYDGVAVAIKTIFTFD